jgi:hypothetical protein
LDRAFFSDLNGDVVAIGTTLEFALNINEASFYEFSNTQLKFCLSTFRKPYNSEDERVIE